MSNPHGLRLALLIAPSLVLLLPSAALVAILERTSHALFLRATTRDVRTGARQITLSGSAHSTSSTPGDTDVTIYEDYATTLALLGVSVVAMLVACLSVCGAWELRRVEGSTGAQRAWAWVLLGSNFVVVGAGVGVLSWASVVQAGQGWGGDEDVGGGQTFTRETWACGIERFYPGEGWAGAVCGLSKATRFMLVPVVVSALLAMASAWVMVRRRGGVGWLFGGKGRYGGLRDAYEMNGQGLDQQLAPTQLYQMSLSVTQPVYAVPPYQYQPAPPQFYQIPQAYAQPGYAAPQGFPSTPYQHPPPMPPMQKGVAVAGEQEVSR